MQSDYATSPDGLQIAFGLLAAFITGGGAYKLVNIWLNRRKPKAEIRETDARTSRIYAEARRINAEADTELNNIIERLHIRIDQMQIGIDDLRYERDDLQLKLDRQEIELDLQDSQMRKMRAFIVLKGLKLSEFDQPRKELDP